MSSKRRLRKNQCTGKKQFSTKAEAWDALYSLRKSGKVSRSERMSVYKCRFCHNWHYGHTPKKILKAIKEGNR